MADPQLSLEPVEHDPFSMSLEPVPHNPFAGITQHPVLTISPTAGPNIIGGLQMSRPAPTEDVHPAWINTRLPNELNRPQEGEAPQIVDLQAMKDTPKGLFEKNVNLLRDYTNVPDEVAQNPNHEEVANWFIGHVKDNLLWLHDQIPQAIRQRSAQWYVGGRKIVDDWSQKFGLKDSAVAGTIAALSPQQDWFQNVSAAHRVLDAVVNKADTQVTQQHIDNVIQRYPNIGKDEYKPLIGQMADKSLNDIRNMNLPEDEKGVMKALWVRLHDHTFNDPSYKLVTPEGEFGNTVTTKSGNPAGIRWGSAVEIGKAIKSIEANGDPGQMNLLMGERHKVRNFYNNLLNPNAPRGDVTIDTHAVAAGLLKPLSGADLEVAHNLATSAPKGFPNAAGSAISGIQGTYPLFAEAYRQAANERGILPREMQSITWEGVRGLFPKELKSGLKPDINNIWTQFKSGNIDVNQARQAVLDRAGGVRSPSWYRPADQTYEAVSHPIDQGKLSQSSLYGGSAGRGRRGPSASRSPIAPPGYWYEPVEHDPFAGGY